MELAYLNLAPILIDTVGKITPKIISTGKAAAHLLGGNDNQKKSQFNILKLSIEIIPSICMSLLVLIHKQYIMLSFILIFLNLIITCYNNVYEFETFINSLINKILNNITNKKP